VKRRPRVPGTWQWRLEVATGGDPIAALVRASRQMPRRPGVWHVDVRHDAGCPASLDGMSACTCEVVEVEARRAA
jgi:hypothetical protein